MTLIDDIARMETELTDQRTSVLAAQSEAESLRDALDEETFRQDRVSSDKIVLDPKLDPDPYGYHGVSLVDRLRAMGWP